MKDTEARSVASWGLLARVVAAILFSQTLHAGFWVVSKLAVIGKHRMAPEVFTWFRYVVSVPVLHLLLWLRTGKPPWSAAPRQEHMSYFIYYGCLHVYFGQYLLFFALQYVPALMAALISHLSPVLVFALGLALGVEHLVQKHYAACLKISGLIVSVAGAAAYVLLKVLVDKQGASEHGHSYDYVTGPLVLITSISGGALYHVLQKTCLNLGYSAVFTTTWGATWGLLLITALVAPHMSPETFLLDGKQIFLVLYDALLPSCVLSVLQTWVTKETSPTFATAFGPLGTALTALFGFVFLGEIPGLATYVSAPVIVMGLLLLVLGRHRESLQSSEPRPGASANSTSESE